MDKQMFDLEVIYDFDSSVVMRLKKRNNEYYKEKQLQMYAEAVEKQQREKNPAVKDAWDKYQILLKLTEEK